MINIDTHLFLVALACKQALRIGYSEICFRTALRIGYSEICFRTARGWAREGEPAMVLARFEYLRSDSERKLLIG